ncbi:zinc-finger domain-containing protein [Alcaligenaceae bacterium 429]|uniref:zinc-finger domain-containing protein n=1 Tax=Paenalcaligenes TaxID=1100891 RepID=UPI001092144B|nr:zinc-finger domain-containing protein [Paenalcaligenes suwonensis]NHC60607.1 zinc-finger domain-containing protein [Paenalcaligenes suwonensis]TGV10355.1 zinc-finger domain-containing protein [Alcaligenaceae bacterium 429]
MSNTQHQNDIIEVPSEDLPVHCPGPHTPLWNMHPRVFIDTSKTGEASCPYCGTTYKVIGDHSHH